MNTYSVRYDGKIKGVSCAADWNWPEKTGWNRSEKDGSGSPWQSAGLIDEAAYNAVLLHFGLEKWADEFPLKKVAVMCPAQLAAARREKEKTFKLERKQMVSDTVGNHCKAEDCNDMRILFCGVSTSRQVYCTVYENYINVLDMYDIDENHFAVVIGEKDITDTTGALDDLRTEYSFACQVLEKNELTVTKLFPVHGRQLLDDDKVKIPGANLVKTDRILLPDGEVIILHGSLVLRVQEKAVEFNFGKSDWARNRPNPSEYPDSIISVSTTKALKELDQEACPSDDHAPALAYDGLEGRATVHIYESSPHDERVEEIFIVWIKERREWILITKSSWCEMVFYDEDYAGPYALDEAYCRKVLKAFKVAEEKISLSKVRSTSPDELKQLAQ